ncbi:MAG: DegT/DnrJ/EryC1/StrS family aminotransferase [Nocardioidaceae bacterium]
MGPPRAHRGAGRARQTNAYAVLEVEAEAAGLARDELVSALRAENVLARTHFHPGCHRTEPYLRSPHVHAPLPLPHTEALGERVVSLPTGTGISWAEVDVVCELVRAVVSHAPEIRRAVAQADPGGERNRRASESHTHRR